MAVPPVPHVKATAVSRRAGFSLIELLVVMSIIAVLAAMLLPTVQLVRDSARTTTCASQERQVICGVLSYASENGGIIPCAIPFNDVGGPTPNAQYADYYFAHQVGNLLESQWDFVNQDTPATQSRLFSCPAQPYFSMPGFRTSYGMCWSGSHPDYQHGAAHYTWLPLNRLSHSGAGVLGEIATDAFGQGPTQWWWIWNTKRIDGITGAAFRHRNGFNGAFADGRVQFIRRDNFQSDFYLPVL
jgi:prepilin-type N-terminal cleavage/methylation domain-containing protein/prepilin-type processing-associated H-X9-DG protein